MRFTKLILLIVMVTFSLLTFSPYRSSGTTDLAYADDLDSSMNLAYPYEKTFIISAYYSPLPCQQRYVTGSYDSDIRLNGGGVRGADGTPVYPGMIAAPKSYAFGTKMYIPGVGIVAVHDRGGAIVNANQRGNSFDRLDIWMGYGDNGLTRALRWGKQTVNVSVYGVTDSVIEDIFLSDYNNDEAAYGDCAQVPSIPDLSVASDVKSDLQTLAAKYDVELASPMDFSLSAGSSGIAVRNLQEELRKLNFYWGEPSGEYDQLTVHAVFKFQQSQGVLFDLDDQGSGVFGPQTREKLNSIIAKRNSSRVLIAQATHKANEGTYLALNKQLDLGQVDDQVRVLKEFLSSKGYLAVDEVSTLFDENTRSALIRFQVDNGIISDSSDFGAGRVGPTTLSTIQDLIS